VKNLRSPFYHLNFFFFTTSLKKEDWTFLHANFVRAAAKIASRTFSKTNTAAQNIKISKTSFKIEKNVLLKRKTVAIQDSTKFNFFSEKGLTPKSFRPNEHLGMLTRMRAGHTHFGTRDYLYTIYIAHSHLPPSLSPLFLSLSLSLRLSLTLFFYVSLFLSLSVCLFLHLCFCLTPLIYILSVSVSVSVSLFINLQSFSLSLCLSLYV